MTTSNENILFMTENGDKHLQHTIFKNLGEGTEETEELAFLEFYRRWGELHKRVDEKERQITQFHCVHCEAERRRKEQGKKIDEEAERLKVQYQKLSQELQSDSQVVESAEFVRNMTEEILEQKKRLSQMNAGLGKTSAVKDKHTLNSSSAKETCKDVQQYLKQITELVQEKIHRLTGDVRKKLESLMSSFQRLLAGMWKLLVIVLLLHELEKLIVSLRFEGCHISRKKGRLKYGFEMAAMLALWLSHDVESNPGPPFDNRTCTEMIVRRLSQMLRSKLSVRGTLWSKAVAKKAIEAGYPRSFNWKNPSGRNKDSTAKLVERAKYLGAILRKLKCLPHEMASLTEHLEASGNNAELRMYFKVENFKHATEKLLEEQELNISHKATICQLTKELDRKCNPSNRTTFPATFAPLVDRSEASHLPTRPQIENDSETNMHARNIDSLKKHTLTTGSGPQDSSSVHAEPVQVSITSTAECQPMVETYDDVTDLVLSLEQDFSDGTFNTPLTHDNIKKFLENGTSQVSMPDSLTAEHATVPNNAITDDCSHTVTQSDTASAPSLSESDDIENESTDRRFPTIKHNIQCGYGSQTEDSGDASTTPAKSREESQMQKDHYLSNNIETEQDQSSTSSGIGLDSISAIYVTSKSCQNNDGKPDSSDTQAVYTPNTYAMSNGMDQSPNGRSDLNAEVNTEEDDRGNKYLLESFEEHTLHGRSHLNAEVNIEEDDKGRNSLVENSVDHTPQGRSDLTADVNTEQEDRDSNSLEVNTVDDTQQASSHLTAEVNTEEEERGSNCLVENSVDHTLQGGLDLNAEVNSEQEDRGSNVIVQSSVDRTQQGKSNLNAKVEIEEEDNISLVDHSMDHSPREISDFYVEDNIEDGDLITTCTDKRSGLNNKKYAVAECTIESSFVKSIDGALSSNETSHLHDGKCSEEDDTSIDTSLSNIDDDVEIMSDAEAEQDWMSFKSQNWPQIEKDIHERFLKFVKDKKRKTTFNLDPGQKQHKQVVRKPCRNKPSGPDPSKTMVNVNGRKRRQNQPITAAKVRREDAFE